LGKNLSKKKKIQFYRGKFFWEKIFQKKENPILQGKIFLGKNLSKKRKSKQLNPHSNIIIAMEKIQKKFTGYRKIEKMCYSCYEGKDIFVRTVTDIYMETFLKSRKNKKRTEEK